MQIPTEPGSAAEYAAKLRAQVRDIEKIVKARIDGEIVIDRDNVFRSITSAIAGRVFRFRADVEENGFKEAISDLTSMGTEALGTAGKVGLIGAAGVVAVGAIGSLVGAFIALGVAGAGAFAAIKLGMDGIKAAAAQLKGPLDDLKKSISDTFQRELTPVFAQLRVVFPVLKAGLDQVAVSLSGIARAVVGVITSSQGLEQLRTALGGISQFIAAAAPGFAALTQSLLTMAAVAAPAMRALGTAISSVFVEFNNQIQELARSGVLLQAFQGAAQLITGLGQAIAPVVGLVIRLGAVLGGPLGTVLSALGQGVTNLTPGMVALGSALGEVLTALAPLLPALGTIIGIIAGALAPILQLLAPLLRVIANVLNFLSPVIGVVTVALAALVGVLFLMTSPVSLVVAAIALLVAGLQALWNSSETFRDIVTGAWNAVVSVITGAPAAIGAAIEAIIGFFTNLPERVTEALTGLGAAITAGAAAAWNFLVTAAQVAVEATVNFLITLPERVAFAIGALGGFILVAATAAWNFLWTTLPNAIAQVGAFLLTLPARAGAALAALGQAILSAATAAFNFLVSATVSGVTSSASFIASLPGRAAAGLAALPGIVIAAATAAFRGFLSAVQSGGAAALAFIGSIPGRVRGFFAGAGSWLFAAGQAIINGLINGLKAAAGAVFAYIAHLASEVKAGFNAAIHARSPSRDFFDIAHDNIGGGLLGGLDAVAPKIMARAAALASEMAQSATGNVSVSSDMAKVAAALSRAGIQTGPFTPSGGATITNHVYAAPGMSPAQIAAETARQQAFELRNAVSSLVADVQADLSGVPV